MYSARGTYPGKNSHPAYVVSLHGEQGLLAVKFNETTRVGAVGSGPSLKTRENHLTIHY